MAELFTSGLIIDGIILLVLVEIVLLGVYQCTKGNGVALTSLLPNLLSGLSLLIGIKLALNNSGWGWLAASLTVALLAHLLDLKIRWTKNS